MLAFDLETKGIDPHQQRVTAACLYGTYENSPFSRIYVFKHEDESLDQFLQEEFMQYLDSADRLCSFNGLRFDIPFMQIRWGVDQSRIESWVLKTFDIFEICKTTLDCTFPLSRLLAANGIENKTGTGLDAITLANTHEWDKLGAYCLQDTRVTYLVSSLDSIILPFSGKQITLQTNGLNIFES